MSLIVNFLTSPTAGNFVQNSTAQVLSEGCLKAVGRPVFTLMDKTAEDQQKKYSATKEFLYQSLSMLAYFALIFPFKNNSFRFLKLFKSLKNTNIANAKTKKEFDAMFKKLPDGELKTKIKGAKEFSAIIASGIILTIITPQLVNKIIHPILENKNNKNNLDKKA